jgi:acetyl-CoA acetyltransferase
VTTATVVGTDVVIAGIGETDYVRGTSRSLQELALEACTRACADAGIAAHEIDGLIQPIAGLGLPLQDIFVPLGVAELSFHATLSLGGAGPAAAVALGAKAISAGLATTVVVPCYIRGYSDIRLREAGAEAQKFDWPGEEIRLHQDFPAGLMVPMQWYSLQANRWLFETGADPVGFQTVALATREHAHRNPKAYFGGRALTAEQYQASEMLVKPFRLYDICLESDGAAAVVLQAAERAAERSDHRPVYVAGGGEGRPDAADNIPERKRVAELGLSRIGPRVLADLGVTLADLDFAQIYDCFTFVVLRQLEELGFCAPGESPEFVAEVGIGPGGKLPVNTHGGLLSGAHIAGMNHVVEAVRQLRDDAGPTQVPGARVGLVTGYGDFGDGSIVVLRN